MPRISLGRTLLTVTLLIIAFASLFSLKAHILSHRSQTPRTMNIAKDSFPTGAYELTRVNNLQASEFPKGFQLEIKNTSKKPIYYLEIDLVLPDSRGYFPSPLVLRLLFGNRKLMNQDTYAKPDDPCLNPGESMVLEPYGKTAQYMYKHLVDRGLHEIVTGRVMLAPQIVNFGDGTCYITGRMYKAEKTRLKSLRQSEFASGFSESGKALTWKPVAARGLFDPCVINVQSENYDCGDLGCLGKIAQNWTPSTSGDEICDGTYICGDVYCQSFFLMNCQVGCIGS